MSIKYSDSGFLDGADETKKLSFDVSGVTTGTTRTITMPDGDTKLYTGDGTSGQVLTSGGAGVAPTFQTAASGDLTPSFQVYMSANMGSLTPGTLYKIQFNSEDYDTDGAWDTTNYKFTVPSGEGGKYLLLCDANSADAGSGVTRYNQIHIYKNGSSVAKNYAHSAGHIGGNSIQRVLTLSVGDYIEFYFSVNDWSYNGTLNTSNNISHTVASGFKLLGV